jgi:AbrB family looped-hinge helix DNA binding protein
VIAKVDSVGRILIPKQLRDALGLQSGSSVDISFYGGGLTVIPHGRTARVVDEDGLLVATSDTAVDDDMVFRLIDSVRT